jgi:PAS domain S-box-containing protein
VKLTTQGLIVIFIPLAFQLLLVATLLILIGQAQEEFEKSVHSEGVVNESNLIVKRLFYGLGAYAFEHAGPDLGGPTMEEAQENFSKEVAELHSRIANDPTQSSADQSLMQLSQTINLAKHSGLGRQQMSQLSRQLVTVLSTIIQTESEKINEAAGAKMQRRNTMNTVLVCFALLGIAVSAAAALICAIRLRKLIGYMTENAARFARREPLAPMMKGQDEVARVDQVIHAMDTAIEEALLKSRALIDNAADLVCSIDRDAYFERVNRFSRQLLGREPEQLIGTSVIELVITEDCALADERINKAFESHLASQFELRLKTFEDQILDTHWSAFWSEEDRSLFCVVGDVTERKNIERLKQDFIGMISHDLRSPLMSVASSISLVQSGALGGFSDGVNRDLSNAEKTLDRLIAMINDLLDFEKLEAGKMQFSLVPISIDEVISEAFREVNAVAEAKDVPLHAEKTGIFVLGDQEKLMQMLINLLANAIRYSPAKTAVCVQCSFSDQTVEVAVLDEGPGVPEGFHEKVFAPFENAPGSQQTSEGGTGLGLAICKLIIEGHNGEIGVRNRAEHGSEFWFTLAKDPNNGQG